MKKVLSLVLVFAMVLGSFSFAFAAAPSDVAGTEYENAVERLSALGVLTGYPDGTFRPNNTITRAEFAAVVVRVKGFETAATAAKGATEFTDVPAEHWASGYVNIASKMGYIKGMGDGTFAPDAPVTYEQAVTMVMRALGYEPAAEDRGGYPLGYLSLADEKDVTDDVDGVVGLAAPRGIVAQLLDNALEVPMMVQTGYGDLKQYEEDEDETLLGGLGLEKVTAKVDSVDTEDLEIVVYEKDDETGRYSEKEEYEVMDGIDIAGLENAIVTLWAKGGEVLSLSVESTIMYDFIAELNGSNEEVEIDGTDTPTEDVKVEEITDLKLSNADETFDIALDEDDNSILTLYLDGEKLDEDEVSKLNLDTKNYYAKFVMDGEEIVTVEAFEVVEGGLIEGIEDDILEYTKGDITRKLRDLDDADEILVVINGEAADYDDLEEGMYFDFAEYDDNYMIVATDANVEGEFDRIKDDEVRIAGEYTALAGSYYISNDEGENYDSTNLEDLFEEEVVAYLNNKGEVAYISAAIEADTDTFYGFVLDTFGFEKEVRLLTLDEEGELDEITFETDLDEDYVDFDELELNVIDYTVNPNGALDALFKFTIDEDGVLTKAEAVTLGSAYDVDSFNDKYDYIEATDNTKVYTDGATIFNVDWTDEEIELLTWDDIEGSDIDSGDGVVFYADDERADVIVFVADSNEKLGEEDLDDYVGFILKEEQTGKDEFEYEVATSEGVVTLKSEDEVNKFDVVVYELLSDDEFETVVDTTYGDLAKEYDELDEISTDAFKGVVNVTLAEDSVDSNDYYFEADVDGDGNNELYKVAKDALIYEVLDSGDDFEEADLADLDDEGTTRDTLYFVMEDGVVKVLFFERN